MKNSKFTAFYLLTLLVFVYVAKTSSQSIKPGRKESQQSPYGHNSVIYQYSTAYQDITTQLRAAILNAELDTAIALLVVSRDVNGLAAGLRYPPEQLSEYRIVTPQRVTDPDVITIKALAGASLRLANCSWKSSLLDDPSTSNPQVLGVLKIAQVAILAITPISGVFPDDVNKFELHLNFIEAFANRTFMQQILDDNPTQSILNRRRALRVVGTSVFSWLCAECYPKRFCRKRCWWCT
eukprot:g434.t1